MEAMISSREADGPPAEALPGPLLIVMVSWTDPGVDASSIRSAGMP